jgi:3-hydroxyisobutyrate dehydrogenase
MTSTKIGLIGTGLMGLPMAQRLMAAGVPLVVYNRTPEKLEPLRAAGATIAPSIPKLLQTCQAVILMLSDAQAIREVVLDKEVRQELGDCTIIQMGTIAPSESRSILDDIIAAGGNYFEAPVLGSIPEVKAGTLLVMVGASVEQFQQWSPLLKHFGPAPLLVGSVGSATALKLALNQLIGSLTTAFALSLGFVQCQGVEGEMFMQILRQSALYAPTFDKKLQRMLEGNFTNPNFPTKHLLKDTNLFLTEAEAIGLQIDSLTGVRRLLQIACNLGLAEEDYSALFAAVMSRENSSIA